MLWVLFIVHQAKVVLLTETITEHFSKINTSDTEIYILGDFNINLFSYQKYIFHQTNTQSRMSNKFPIFSFNGLEQLIKPPTGVTYSKSSLIDHIRTTFPERVSQEGLIYVVFSDHQLICCDRKFSCTKVETHKQIRFRSLKTAEAYKEALSKVYFPNYEIFSDVSKASQCLNLHFHNAFGHQTCQGGDILLINLIYYISTCRRPMDTKLQSVTKIVRLAPPPPLFNVGCKFFYSFLVLAAWHGFFRLATTLCQGEGEILASFNQA